MHARNAICTAITVAFISALSWGLHALGPVLGVPGFLIFCVVTFAIMVSCGYAWDRYGSAPLSAGATSNYRQAAARDDYHRNSDTI